MESEGSLLCRTTQPVSPIIDLSSDLLPVLYFEIRETEVMQAKTSQNVEVKDELSLHDLIGLIHTLISIYSHRQHQAKEEYRKLGGLKKRAPKKETIYPLIPRKLLQKSNQKEKKTKRVLDLYKSTGMTNYQIAKLSRCPQSFVKKIVDHFDITGACLNQSSSKRLEERQKRVEKAIAEVKNPFMVVSQLTRSKTLSTQKMSASQCRLVMKSMGYFYKDSLLPIKSKKRKAISSLMEEKKEKEVTFINQICQFLMDTEYQVLFLDQFKAPIQQIPRHTWRLRKKGKWTEERASFEDEVLTCNVICSESAFLYLMISKKELTQAEADYFFNESLLKERRRYPTKKLKVVLDNGPWQKAKILEKMWFHESLLYTIPGSPHLNVIETAFSKIRGLWRRRPLANHLDQELENLIIFFKKMTTVKDFAGYMINYMNTLLNIAVKVAKKYNKQEDYDFEEEEHYERENKYWK
jgi:transposase